MPAALAGTVAVIDVADSTVNAVDTMQPVPDVGQKETPLPS